MINGRNVVVFDNAGIPSFMVRFDKSKISDYIPGGAEVTHPAFIIDNEEVDEIYLSKYPNTIINGKAYSLPFCKPAVNLTQAEAMEACFSKGEGWHMITAPEYALPVLESQKNKTFPHGNTNWGSDSLHPEEKGECFDGCKTLTGSGPATWSHDHTPYGVHDLCGNVWEMIAGLRLLNGEIQIVENNNAANGLDFSKESGIWKPVLLGGESVKFTDSSSGLKLTTEAAGGGWDGCRWTDLEVDIEVPETLKALALYPLDKENEKSYVGADSEGERFPIRGGGWHNGSNAGVFNLLLACPRSYSSTGFGFRSAFYCKRKTA